MKKLFALFLIAVMCVSLIACGESEQQADNNNSQVIHDNQQADNNNSQTVHDEQQTNNNDAQQEQSNNINDDEMYIEIDMSEVNVVGTWKSISGSTCGDEVVINEDGTGTIYSDEEINFTWLKTDEEIVFDLGYGNLKFKSRVNNGIVEMIEDEGYLVLRTVQDYENTVECVEITLDNWQEYFEIKPCAAPNEYLKVAISLVLKDEYVNSYLVFEGESDAIYDGEYRCPMSYNSVTKEVSLGAPYTQAECEQKGYDVNGEAEIIEGHDLDLNITECGREYCFSLGGGRGYLRDEWKIDGDVITVDAFYYETIEITRIQGNLYLKK